MIDDDEIEQFLKEQGNPKRPLQFKKKKLINRIIQKYHEHIDIYSIKEYQTYIEEQEDKNPKDNYSLKKRIKIVMLFNILFHLNIISSVDKNYSYFFDTSPFCFFYFCHLNQQNKCDPNLLQNHLVAVADQLKKEITIKDKRNKLLVQHKNCFDSNVKIFFIFF